MSEVLEEHLDYISMRGRDGYYRDAIAKALQPGDVVADLGCGFGILGILCLEAGASHVYGVEHADAIEIARESVLRAGLADRYTCIRGITYRIDLPEKVDLVICDHIGWFGFDYNIIHLLRDANARFLKPGGTMVPNRLRLHCAGVSSQDCRDKAEAWISEPVSHHYHWLNEYSLNTKHAFSFSGEELLTDEGTFGEVDLTAHEPENYAFKTKLVASRDGRFDGIAGWCHAELANDVWMTNSPLAEGHIRRDQVFLAVEEPFDVKAGDEIEISLRFRYDDPMITWIVRGPRGTKTQKMSTWKATVLTQQDLVTQSGDPVSLSQVGKARQVVLTYIDGKRTGREVEDAVLTDHPTLFPTESATRRFVNVVLAQDGMC